MIPLLFSFLTILRDTLRTRVALQAEILALRHQLLVLQRRKQKQRLRLSLADRLLWVWLSRIWPEWRAALRIVKPETVIAWHRKGFRLYWSWKSRPRKGRPPVSTEVRELIRRMSVANPGWGAPRIHGELGKLGIQVSETTVAKYMLRHRNPPSQTWRTFLTNHIQDLVSADFFVVPTATFRLLFVFVILSHDRRRLVHFAVPSHPTAEWTAQQLLQAFPWDTAARYLLRDRDGNYGKVFRETAAGAGHRRGALCSTLALAKCLRGAVDRVDTARMPGSGYRRPPVGSPTSVEFLFCVLRWLAHSSVPRQGRTDSSRYSAARTRQSAGIARSWRSAPPIRTSRSLTKRSPIVVCFHVAVFRTLRRWATFDPLRSGTRTRVALEVLCDAIGSPLDFVVGTGWEWRLVVRQSDCESTHLGVATGYQKVITYSSAGLTAQTRSLFGHSA